MNTLVVDTNVIISALIRDGFIREILINFGINLVFPEYGLKEIYSYKNEIMNKAGLLDKEFDVLLLRLLKYVRLVPLDLISKYEEEANEIMFHIDEKDVQFVATALAFDCGVWSDDKHFKMQDEIKVYTTYEVVELLK